MNLPDFYSVCEEFDWSYLMAEDASEFRRGRAGEDKLIALADTPEKLALLSGFKNHHYHPESHPKPQPPLTGQKDQDHMKKREIPQAAPVAEPVVGQTIWYFYEEAAKMVEAKIEAVTPEEIVTTYASLNRATDKFHVARPDGDVYTEKSVYEPGAPVLVAAPAPAPKPALTLKVGDKIDVMHAPTNTWKGAEITSIDPNGEFAACRVEGMKKSSQYNLAMDTAPYRSKSTEPVAQPEPAVQQPVVVHPSTVEQLKADAAAAESQTKAQANELAVPGKYAWFEGVGFDPEMMRERPRLILSQNVSQHIELGLRFGEIGLNSLVLSPLVATGVNGLPKVGDMSKTEVKFFVTHVRTGVFEDIPNAEFKANPQLRAQTAFTDVAAQALRENTRYALKPFADLYLLVEKPEGLEDTSGQFSVKIGSKVYAPAVARAKNSSYRGYMAPISTIAENNVGMLHFYRFGLRIKIVPGQTLISVPEISRLGFAPEADRGVLQDAHERTRRMFAAVSGTPDDTPAT